MYVECFVTGVCCLAGASSEYLCQVDFKWDDTISIGGHVSRRPKQKNRNTVNEKDSKHANLTLIHHLVDTVLRWI